MPNFAESKRRVLNGTLELALKLLPYGPNKNVPDLWVVNAGEQPQPFVGAAETPVGANINVVLRGGSCEGRMATRVGTDSSGSRSFHGFLLSTGFQSCVAVAGVGKDKIYLAHFMSVNDAICATRFKDWERAMKVLIVRKSPARDGAKASGHEAKVLGVKNFCERYFTGGCTVLEVGWAGSTAVLLHKSSCVAYKDADLDEPGVALSAQ